jgi:hypothetical protein
MGFCHGALSVSTGPLELNYNIPAMEWPKLAIAAGLLAAAIAAALTWHKGAGSVVLPVTLVALYVVWRWRRDD